MVNYVIATWSGPRRCPNKYYLRTHLERLSQLKHNLDQITVVKPLGSDDKDYYGNIQVLERPSNIGISYGQWLYAYETFGDKFDSYIFVEDDYIPNIDHFDMILEGLGADTDYLCSKAGADVGFPAFHAAVSNGIIKTSALKTVYKKFKDPISLIDRPDGGMVQFEFSQLFTNAGCKISDYSKYYTVPYWGRRMRYYSDRHGMKTLFTPYQGLFDFPRMTSADLPFLLEIRNNPSTRYFLENNQEFTLRQCEKWFETLNMAWFIVTFGDNPVGYVRRERKQDGVYVGVDIHPAHRKKGYATEAYRKLLRETDENLYLWAFDDNFMAKKYRDLGFIEIGSKQVRGRKYIKMVYEVA